MIALLPFFIIVLPVEAISTIVAADLASNPLVDVRVGMTVMGFEIDILDRSTFGSVVPSLDNLAILIAFDARSIRLSDGWQVIAGHWIYSLTS